MGSVGVLTGQLTAEEWMANVEEESRQSRIHSTRAIQCVNDLNLQILSWETPVWGLSQTSIQHLQYDTMDAAERRFRIVSLAAAGVATGLRVVKDGLSP